MTNPHDELDELLAPPDAGNETPGLRESLLRRTQAHLTWTRWVRRGVRLAGAAAIFALGIGVGAWRTSERDRVVTVREVETVTVAVPVVVPVAVSAAEPAPPAVVLTAAQLELDAEQVDDVVTAANLYKRAGDAYLTARQDYANAARCYRLFLARSGDGALAPEANDSWLLTSIKNAVFKEKIHATATNG